MKNKKQEEKENKSVEKEEVLTEKDLEDLSPEKEETNTEEKVDQEQKNEPDKSQEYLEMAQRIQAEFDNYRKRTNEQANESRKNGIMYAVEALLPVIDSISSAKRQVKDEIFLKSLDMIYKQTLSCFSKLGVNKIDCVGKPFDPLYHNAIMTEHKDDVEPDIVLDEFQEGFKLDDKVIRHSVVKVSK